MNIGDTVTLKDSRDGTKYLVGKLKKSSSDSGTTGGWCWMLDNLALDLSDSAVKANLTSTTTNAPDTNLTNLKNNVVAKTANGGSWTDTYTVPYIATGGFGSVGRWTKDTVAPTKYGSGSGKLGVYYNYCAASAGTYCYSSYSSSDVTADVCPAGWRLPTGGQVNTSVTPNQGEFQTLYDTYGNYNNNFSIALSTPLSGNFYSDYAGYLGRNGNWWSSTLSYSTYMYNLRIDGSGVDPKNYNGRDYGYSIRCILK